MSKQINKGKICSEELCEKPAHCKGLCRYHYDRRYYLANEEEVKQLTKTWREEHSERQAMAKGLSVRFASDAGSGSFHELVLLVLEQIEPRDRLRCFGLFSARLGSVGLQGVEEPLEPTAPPTPQSSGPLRRSDRRPRYRGALTHFR